MAGGVPGPESKLSEETLRTICEALAAGMSRSHAAGLGGVHHSTLLRWAAEHPHVEKALLLAESSDVARCFDVINDVMREADTKTRLVAATWKLRNQHGYSDKSEVAVVAGEPNGRALDPSRLTDDEYETYLALVEKMTIGADKGVVDAEFEDVAPKQITAKP